MKHDLTWGKDGYVMRLLTGSKASFTREEVLAFFHRSLADTARRFFLVFDPAGNVIGESVINEIDEDLRCANFRIAIFRPGERGRGLGSWMVETTRNFAFEQLHLHRLELDVFSFNTRAMGAYRRAGFRQEGIRRDAVRDGDGYGDDVLMAILEEEWREMQRG